MATRRRSGQPTRPATMTPKIPVSENNDAAADGAFLQLVEGVVYLVEAVAAGGEPVDVQGLAAVKVDDDRHVLSGAGAAVA